MVALVGPESALSPESRVSSPKTEEQNSKKRAFIGLSEPGFDCELVKICASTEEYAREVFAFFRRCDRARVETVYCQTVQEKGIGTALMDRHRRAAED